MVNHDVHSSFIDYVVRLTNNRKNITLNKTKTLIARQKKAKEKTLKWTSQTGKEPYENRSEKNRALQNAKNNKTTKKKSSDRRRPS